MLDYKKGGKFAEIVDSFVRKEKTLDFPAIVGISMSMLESGNYRYVSGNNNYLGITTKDKTKGKLCPTREYITDLALADFLPEERATAKLETPGNYPSGTKRWYKMKRYFRNYASVEESVVDYIRLITTVPRYRPAITRYRSSERQRTDCERLITDLSDAGYSSASAAKAEIRISRQLNVAYALTTSRKKYNENV
jgi:uncharacterized FlgJ-related protein